MLSRIYLKKVNKNYVFAMNSLIIDYLFSLEL